MSVEVLITLVGASALTGKRSLLVHNEVERVVEHVFGFRAVSL